MPELAGRHGNPAAEVNPGNDVAPQQDEGGEDQQPSDDPKNNQPLALLLLLVGAFPVAVHSISVPGRHPGRPHAHSPVQWAAGRVRPHPP
jgi:hypothetical protein